MPAHPDPDAGQPADAIAAAGLTRSYRTSRGAVRALDGVSLSVPAGSLLGLLGPNGAGKSTTVRILTTLARPDGGHAEVAGLDVVRQAPQVRRVIGYVPQRPSFDPASTGRENLVLQARVHGLPTRQVLRRADELLERFHLGAAADRLARTWSGGMQRKLDIALALVHGPEVLFLDEPTVGLDPEARTQLWVQVADLLASDRLTVLLSTHYLEEADRMADHVAILDRGRVVAHGTPGALKRQLAGDRIEIELSRPARWETIRTSLGSLVPPAAIHIEGSSVRLEVRDGTGLLPSVLAALTTVGALATSVAMTRPSLGDVYLRHAGRSFRAADTAGREEVS